MRHIILTLIACIGCVSAQDAFLMSGKASFPLPAAGGSCNTAQDSFNGAKTAFINLVSGRKFGASRYVPGTSFTCCKVTIYMEREGTASGDLSVGIYSDNAGEPGSVITGFSSTVAASGVSTDTGTPIEFSGLSAALTSGITYWIVVQTTSSGTAGNSIVIDRENAASQQNYGSNDGATWSSLGTTTRIKCIIYSN